MKKEIQLIEKLTLPFGHRNTGTDLTAKERKRRKKVERDRWTRLNALGDRVPPDQLSKVWKLFVRFSNAWKKF